MLHVQTLHENLQTLLDADSLEDIKASVSGGDEDAGQLRVPVQFFDLFLSLMNEQQLWGDVGGKTLHFHLVRLNG